MILQSKSPELFLKTPHQPSPQFYRNLYTPARKYCHNQSKPYPLNLLPFWSDYSQKIQNNSCEIVISCGKSLTENLLSSFVISCERSLTENFLSSFVISCERSLTEDFLSNFVISCGKSLTEDFLWNFVISCEKSLTEDFLSIFVISCEKALCIAHFCNIQQHSTTFNNIHIL